MTEKKKPKSRRSNGEGSIFQDKEGNWIAKIQIGRLPNGNPKIKKFKAKTEREVRKSLQQYIKSGQSGSVEKNPTITLSEYYKGWLKVKFLELKPQSYDRLESTINNHILPELGYQPLKTINSEDIQALINRKYDEGLSYSSIKKIYEALNACYEYGINFRRDIGYNPVKGVVMPRKSKFKSEEVSYFSNSQIELILNEIKRTNNNGVRIYAWSDIFILILNTGMREGEAAALKWDAVDFSAKTIRIHSTSTSIKERDNSGVYTGNYITVEQDSTKSQSSNRTVPLNRTALEALESLKAISVSQYVISTNTGNMLRPFDLNRTFSRILENAGINGKYGVHTLRHTFATILFHKGVDVKTVSKILGHQSVRITYDIYVHILRELEIRAIDSIPEL